MTENSNSAPIQFVAFDFDGTITTEDTFALFLKYYAGKPRWALNVLKLLPIFIGYGVKLLSRDTVKVHVIRTFFKGADSKQLHAKAEAFAKDVIPGLIRPGALAHLAEKNTPPYTLYIVSASIGPYLRAWAHAHGIENVLCTELEESSGRATGEIDGINCWGPGKTAKIAAEMGPKPYTIVAAYGDTRGDQEMLHAADASFWRPFRL